MTVALRTPAALSLRPIPTFLGAPIADLDDLRPGDVALVGLFLDHGDAGRLGKRFAARQVRYASALALLRPPAGPRGRCFDLGDLNVFPLEPVRQTAALHRQIGAIANAGAIPVIVGGRALPFPLGEGLPAAVPTIRLPDTPLEGSAHVALVADLAPAFDRRAEPRAASQLLGRLTSCPAPRIAAAHLTGFAPDLDVGGRYEASLAAQALARIAAHLVGDRPCH